MESGVSVLRLNLLRAAYCLIFVGLGMQIWPAILRGAPVGNVMHGVGRCLLGALSLLCALGIRYPLRMLPLMLFEFTWKAIWLTAIALPLWLSNQMGPDSLETAENCLAVVILVPLMPWRYIWANFAVAPGDPWVSRRPEAKAHAAS